MLTRYSELNEERYQQLRYDAIVNAEENGDPKEFPYLDSQGIPTIGVGFNLQSQNVREAVLAAFGLDPNSTNLSEQSYVTQIANAVSQTYGGTTQAERDAALQAALNAIMFNRANDDSVPAPASGIKRDSFTFTDESEIRNVFDTLIGQYEAAVDEWLPDIPDSSERVSLVSLSWEGLLGVRRRGDGTVITDAEGNVLYKSPGLREAIINGNRAQAWYEIRYNTNKGAAADAGEIAKRRYYESGLLGLYDPLDPNGQPLTAMQEQARAFEVYQMYTLHRDRILDYEQRYGGGAADNRIDAANADYGLQGEQRVLSLEDSFAAAYDTILEAFVTPLDSGVTIDYRDIQIGVDGVETLSGTLRNGFERNQGDAKSDLIIGEGGNDTINGGGASDILYGGAGNDTLSGDTGSDYLLGGEGSDEYIIESAAGSTDTAWDTGLEGAAESGDDRYIIRGDGIVNLEDGSGTEQYRFEQFSGTATINDSGANRDTLLINGQSFNTGLSPVNGDQNTWQNADGTIALSLDGSRLTISTPEGGAIRIEDFRSGDFGFNTGAADSQEPEPGANEDVTAYSDRNVQDALEYAFFAKLVYNTNITPGSGTSFRDQILMDDAILDKNEVDPDPSGTGDDRITVEGDVYKLFRSIFRPELAERLSSQYDVLDVYTDPVTGFAGMLFRETATGELILALRGTEFENDLHNDMLLTNSQIAFSGFALPQAVSLQQFLDRIKSSDYYNEGDTITSTGHSLGGHLAIVAKMLEPDMIESVQTFNAPGLNFTGAVSSQIAATFGVSDEAANTFFSIMDDLNPTGALKRIADPSPPGANLQRSGINDTYEWYQEDPEKWVEGYAEYVRTISANGSQATEAYLADYKNTLDAIMRRAGDFQPIVEQAKSSFSIFEVDGDAVSELVLDPATPHLFYTENEERSHALSDVIGAGARPHSMTAIVSSLMVHNLFYSIDSLLSANTIGRILSTASKIGFSNGLNPTLEIIVNQLSALFNGGNYDGEVRTNDDRASLWNMGIEVFERFQSEVVALTDVLQSLFGGTGKVVSLESISPEVLYDRVMENSLAGNAYRYALENSVSFAVVSNIDSTLLADDRYSLESFRQRHSDRYIQDRVLQLSLMVQRNDADLGFEDAVAPEMGDRLIADSADPQRNLSTGGEVDAATQRILFGSGESDYAAGGFHGGQGDDSIYGLGGDDELVGGGGNDYIEGGDGDDRILGGAGSNILSGGSGNDIFIMDSEAGSINLLADRDGHDQYNIAGAGEVSIVDSADSDSYRVHDFSGVVRIDDAQKDLYERLTIDGFSALGWWSRDAADAGRWIHDENGLSLRLDGTTATIETADGGEVILLNFSPDDFGIFLNDGSGPAPGPDAEPVSDIDTQHSTPAADLAPIDTLEYRIVQGDSISLIMQRMGLNYYDGEQRALFLSANDLENADLIFAGAALVNPFHADYVAESEPVVPRTLANAITDVATPDVPVSNGQALSGTRDAEAGFNYSVGQYGIDVEKRVFEDGRDTTDVSVNLGPDGSLEYDENVFSGNRSTTDINLQAGSSRFIYDEKIYESGQKARDIELVAGDSSLIVNEQIYTIEQNGQQVQRESRDIELAVDNDHLSVDQTVLADGRRLNDIDIQVGDDFLRVDEEAFANDRETRDINLSVDGNVLNVDEKIYDDGREARDVEIRVGEDYLTVEEEAYTNGGSTRDVDLRVGENRISVDETIDTQGRELRDIRVDAGDDQLLVDEQVAGDGSIVTDTFVKVGENSLQIDKEIDEQGRATDFLRIEAGDDYLEIDENVQANGEVTTDYDVKVDQYRIDSGTTVDDRGNKANDLLIQAGDDRLVIDEEYDDRDRRTTDTVVEIDGVRLNVDQEFEGAENRQRRTTDYDVASGDNRLRLREDIDDQGNETEYFRLDLGDNYLEVDDNVEANGEVTTDYEAQYDDNRINIERDIDGSNRAIDYFELKIGENRLELDENVEANGAVTRDVDLTIGEARIDIDNDINSNGFSSRDISFSLGEDSIKIDDNVDLQGQKTTDVTGSIGPASIFIDEISRGNGAVDTILNYRVVQDGEAIGIEASTLTGIDGVRTDFTRVTVNDSILQVDENVEANGSITTDVGIKIDNVLFDREIDIEESGARSIDTTIAVDSNRLTVGEERRRVGRRPVTAEDVQLETESGRFAIDQTIEADGEVTTDWELQSGERRLSFDEQADGTTDIGITQNQSSSLYLDHQVDGTVDTTIVSGEGTITVDEHADGTTDTTVRYPDTTIVFNEERGAGNAIVTAITIATGASTIELANGSIITADINETDSNITQDQDGNYQIVLPNGQGVLNVGVDGSLNVSLTDGESIVTLNEFSELHANLVDGSNSVVFDQNGTLMTNWLNGGSSASLTSTRRGAGRDFSATLSEGSSSLSFDSQGDVSASIVDTDGNSVVYDSSGGVNVEIDHGTNRFQYNGNGSYDVALSDGNSSVAFDSSGDFDVTLVRDDNRITFNERREFEATLSDGNSSLTIDDQGRFSAGFSDGVNRAQFDNSGGYEIDLTDGQSRVEADDTGMVAATLGDGSSSVSYVNDPAGGSEQYSVLLSDGQNSLGFDSLGTISALATDGDREMSVNLSDAGRGFGVSNGESGLTVGLNPGSMDITLSADGSSLGVTTAESGTSVTLDHADSDTSLGITNDTDGLALDVTHNGNSFGARRNSDGSSSVEATIDSETFSYSEDRNGSTFGLSSGDVGFGVTRNSGETTVSLSEGADREISVTDDGDGLDYRLREGDAGLTWENEADGYRATLSEGENSVTAGEDGSITIQRGDTALTVDGTDEGFEATLSRPDENQSLSVSDDGDGLDVAAQSNNDHLRWENEGSISRVIVDNSEQELTVTDDGNGIDVRVEDGDAAVGIDNNSNNTTAYLEVSGVRLERNFDPADVISRLGSTIGNLFADGADAFRSLDGGIFAALGGVISDLADTGFSLGSLMNTAEATLDDALALVGEYQQQLAEGLAGQVADELNLSGESREFVEAVAAGYLQEVFSYFDAEDGEIDFGAINQQVRELGTEFLQQQAEIQSGQLAQRLVDELGIQGDFAKDVFSAYIEELITSPIDGDIDLSDQNQNFGDDAATIFSDQLAAAATRELSDALGLDADTSERVAPLITEFVNNYTDGVAEYVTGQEVQREQFDWQSAAASIIVAELADELGLEGEVATAFNQIGSQALTQLITNIAEGAELTRGLSASNFSAASLQLIGSYVGAQLGEEVYEVKSKEGVIGSSFGTAAGAEIGATIGSAFGPVGTFAGAVIGAFVGYVFGGFLGDLFGGTPRSAADVIFNHNTGEFEITNVWRKDGGSESAARRLATAARDALNSVVQAIGGEILNEGVIYGGTYGMREDSYTYRPAGRDSERTNSSDGLALVTHGVLSALDNLQIAGGNVYVKRAVDRIVDEMLSGGTIPEDALQTVVGVLTTALDYQRYLDNADEINELMQNAPDSTFTAGWIATFEQAQALGLTQRHVSDHIGGWRYLVESEEVEVNVNDQLTAELVAPNFSDVELTFEGNARVIRIVRADGSVATVDDLIDPSTKDVIAFSNQAVLDAALENVLFSAVINGTASGDTIRAGDSGNDVFGGGGDDTIFGGANADWLFGGQGNDSLHAAGGENNALFGGEGDDTLVGAGGSDWLVGGAGVDEISGGAGSDVLDGGAGNDTVEGQAGDDIYLFRRGDGADVIVDRDQSFNEIAAGAFDLSGLGVWLNGVRGQEIGGGRDTIEFGDGIGLEHVTIRRNGDDLVITLLDDNGQTTQDSLTLKDWDNAFRRIETLRFSDGQEIDLGNFQTFIIGTSGDDRIIGTNNNDFIHGGLGDDDIRALLGDDVAIGGLGNDVVSGGGDNDLVIGGAGGDNLYGDAGSDVVSGDGGNDILRGGAGNDALSGGRGDDRIITGEGNDTVFYGRGDGRDSLVDAEPTAAGNVELAWSGQTGFANGYSRSDIFETTVVGYDENGEIYGERLRADFFRINNYGGGTTAIMARVTPDNVGVIDSGQDRLEFKLGISLQDIRVQRDGEDLLLAIGDTGNPFQSFGEIEDTVRIVDWFGNGGASIETFTVYGFGDINAAGFSGWIGGDNGNNVINGGSGRDWITSGAGQDVVSGGLGDDIISAGADNDIVSGGAGSDILLGGQGEDTLDYSDSANGISISLTTGEGTAGEAAGDRVDGFENIIGSDFGDVIVADAGDNEITTGTGSDRAVGGEGNDRYIYNRGDGDLVIAESDASLGVAGGGDDILQFGEGINPADLGFSRSGLNLVIDIAGTSGTITIENWYADGNLRIEQFLFVDGGAINVRFQGFSPTPTGLHDWISGTTAGETLQGSAGNDILSGRGGRDTLQGGIGNDLLLSDARGDTLDGGSGNDTVAYYDSDNGIAATLTAVGGSATGGDQFFSIENLIGSRNNDSLTGNRFINTLAGGRGDDRIDGGAGDDTLQGDTGNDIILGGVGRDEITGNNGEDLIYGGAHADDIRGGDENDTLHGDTGDDFIDGGGGDDRLYGGADNDLLLGGLGNDLIEGGDGADDIRGDYGDDTLRGGAGNDALFGEAGDDVIEAEDGDDYARGNEGNDTILGGSGADVLEGEAGADRLDGGADDDLLDGGIGDDTLRGGSGTDILIGGEGNDRLEGGEGSDIYVFADNFGQDVVSEDAGRDESDDILFSEIATDSLWFEEDGNDLVISVIGTDNQVRIENYNRFRINTDISGELLEALNDAFSDLSPVKSITTDTDTLSLSALNELIDVMAGHQRPDTEQDIPSAVADAQRNLWQPSEISVEARLTNPGSDADEIRFEVAPVIENQSFSLDEGQQLSGRLLATDENPDDIITFNLRSAPSEGNFSINTLTGNFVYVADADFSGTVNAVVGITDSTGRTDTANVSFQISPIDDPLQAPFSAVLTTSEGAPVVSRVLFTDADTPLNEYTINVDPQFGTITLLNDGRVEYTPLPNVAGIDSFTATLTDPNGNEVSTNFIVRLFDQNDRPETAGRLDFDAQEDGSISGQIVVQDPDVNDTHTFEVLSAGAGVFTRFEDGFFDYTLQPNFVGEDRFIVRVTDSSGDAISFSDTEVVINVSNTNDAPVVAANVNLSTSEEAAVSGSLQFSDLDAPYGDAATFSATPDSGTIAFSPDGTFTYTPDQNFSGNDSFIVTARDSAGALAQSAVSIDVAPVNDAPVTTASLELTTDEDVQIAGDLGLSDPDVGDTHTFNASPALGEISFNSDGTFLYVPNPDANGRDEFTVTVTDSAGSSAQSNIAVNITPVDDDPNQGVVMSVSGPLSVQENIDPGYAVATITRSATGEGLSYVLSNNAGGRFAIDQDGVITTTAAFDRESNTSFQIEVQLQESDGNVIDQVGQTITIANVNEAPFDLAPDGQFAVIDDVEADVEVGSVRTLDPDVGETFSYELINTADGRFRIDSNGRIFTASDNFDARQNASHAIQVRVTDAGGLSYTESFVVAVSGANQAPSDIQFSGPLSVAENLGVTAVGTARAVDVDGLPIIYSVAGVFDANGDAVNPAPFSINSSTGVISTTQALDAETNDAYRVVVRATDQTGLYRDEEVGISVLNANELPNPVEFSGNFVLLESDSAGTVVGTVSGSDPDAGDSVALSLVNDGDGYFRLNGNQIVKTTKVIDFESPAYAPDPEYTLVVRATDRNGLYTDTSHTVSIVDVDEAPEIELSISVDENQTGVVGQLVNDMDAGDDHTIRITGQYASYFDINENGSLILNSPFNFGSQFLTEEPLFSGGPSGRKYTTIDVSVTDSQGQSDSASVGVFVNNVDEPAYGFSYTIPSIDATDANPGDLVAVIGVNDPDTAEDIGPAYLYDSFDDYSLTLLENPGGWFELNGSSLRLSDTPLPTNQDFTTTVRVRADADHLDHSFERDLTIRVFGNRAPVALGTDTISITEYSAWRPEDGGPTGGAQANQVIYNIANLFSDPDGDTLTYGVSSNNLRGSATSYLDDVNEPDLTADWNFNSTYGNRSPISWSSTGLIRIATPELFDRELVDEFNIYVYASDGSRSAQSTITVRLNDLEESQLISSTGGTQLRRGSAGSYRWLVDPMSSDGRHRAETGGSQIFRDWQYELEQRMQLIREYGVAPVVLDLDGNGFDWSNNIAFDVDSDGELELTGWVGSEDGILALDGNGNGAIDNGSEISFTDDLQGATTDLEGLAAYDTNADGVLSAADDRYGDFIVWRDSNQNGVSEAEELFNFADLGIVSINLNGVPNDPASVADGVNLLNTSEFTRADNSVGIVGDVVFDVSQISPEDQAGYAPVRQGTSGDDVVLGTLGADNIEGLAGNDSILGSEGHDWLKGGEGDDTLAGEEGVDTLSGDAGSDELRGDLGDDLLFGGDGDDYLEGGAGDDILSGDAGNDFIDGDDGINTVVFRRGDGADVLAAADGNYVIQLAGIDQTDVVFRNLSNSLLIDFGQGDRIEVSDFDAGALQDYESGARTSLSGIAFEDGVVWEGEPLLDLIFERLGGTIAGSFDADSITGSRQGEVINAYDGDDVVDAGQGDDRVYGHEGDDVINAGDGHDYADGGLGNDSIAGGAGDDRLYGGDGDDSLSGEAGDDSLYGGDGHDRLSGDQGDDQLSGQAGDDILSGGDGADQLDGGAGNDVLQGGAGDDSLSGGGGADTIQAGAGEDYIEGGAGSDVLSGGDDNDIVNAGEGDDQAYGDAGTDVLVGGSGDDLLDGGSGDDALYGDGGRDELTGGAGDDILSGGADDDFLEGGIGNDLLDGGQGVNTIRFSRGDGVDTVAAGDIATHRYEIVLPDIAPDEVSFINELTGTPDGQATLFVVDFGQGDRIIFEGGGITADNSPIDALRFMSADADGNPIELVIDGDNLSDEIGSAILRGTEGDDVLVGTDDDDTIEGRGGNDYIDGRGGADTMHGGEGDDTFVVDNSLDTVIEQAMQGLDWVNTHVDYTLGSNLENLRLVEGAVSGTGNELDNRIIGNDENNILDGGAGADALTGGLGDDEYFIDHINDTIVEMANEGFDAVNAAINYSLDDNVEKLTLVGTAVSGYGNALDNILIGNDELNQLFGGAGDDTYVVDNAGDEIIEAEDEGNDSVLSSVDYTLSDNVENLVLQAGAISGTGNTQNNYLLGNDRDNILSGEGGSDLFEGGRGNDTLNLGWGLHMVRFTRGDGRDTVNTPNSYAVLDLIDIAPEDLSFTVEDGSLTLELGQDEALIFQDFDILDSEETLPIAEIRFSYEGQEITWERDYISFLVESQLATAVGTDNDDYIKTGNDDDRIATFGGDDRIRSRNGDDVVLGGAGNDWIDTGNGKDHALGGTGDDIIDTGRDDDYLDGGAENDLLKGGRGDDSYKFDVGDGRDIISDRWGKNGIIFGNGIGLNTITLERQGFDLIVRYSEDDEIVLKDQVKELCHKDLFSTFQFANGASITLDQLLSNKEIVAHGTLYGDFVMGTRWADIVFAGDGNDRVWGGHGDDLLQGEAGNDKLYGGSGNDQIRGGDGNDVLYGHDGDDYLDGGSGKDYLNGGYGDDIYSLESGDGHDTIIGDRWGQDTLILEGDINADNVWIERDGRDLTIGIIGTEDNMTVDDWFRGERYQVEAIQIGDEVITNFALNNLLQSMAAFGGTEAIEMQRSIDEENNSSSITLAAGF